jgi:dihydroceramidase
MNYWGEPDGSIDFCEENYKENMYIAEYWNTISASVYFLIGMLWIFTKYKKIAFSFMFLSLGTALWHGTLRYWGQWLDEVGMLILTFNLIQEIHPSLNTWWLGLLIGIYFAFQEMFLIFGGLFVVLQCYLWLCARLMKISDSWNWTFYNWLLLISAILWILDTFFCNPSGINCHAFWHITTALASHFGMRIKDKFDYYSRWLKAEDAREFYLNS